MKDICFVNGQFVPREQAVVSIEDRGYQFGDGVYEVIRFHGRKGLRVVPHLERLLRSSEALRISGGSTVEQWLAIIEELIEKCDLPTDSDFVTGLYIQVSRGVAPRNHLFPKEKIKPAEVAGFRLAPQHPAEARENGVKLSTQPDERWNRCFIKAIALLPAVLSKQAATEAGAYEALLVRDGVVTEGGATNVFCVRNGAVYTHPEGPYILSGITREVVFEAAKKAGISLYEEPVRYEDFLAADEAFISSTTMDIMPVTKIDDDKIIGDGKVGPVTKALIEAFNEIIAQEIY